MKYKVGLVVGKFSPLHKGHEYLIKTALAECIMVVVICYSNPNLGYSEGIRRMWIQNIDHRLVVITPTDSVPHNDAPEKIHRDFCASLCETQALLKPDVVFSSESYGEGFAAHLSARWDKPVQNVVVDQNRSKFPISGTSMRNNLYPNFLSPFVAKTIPKRILFVGGESSGKTTLCNALQEFTNCPMVLEFGRYFCSAIGGVARLTLQNMTYIGLCQIILESGVAKTTTKPFIWCDTSPLTTACFSLALFGEIEPSLLDMSMRTYDKVFLCSVDGIPFEQDGDRNSPEFSLTQEKWYADTLKSRGVEFMRLTGSVEERMDTVLENI